MRTRLHMIPVSGAQLRVFLTAHLGESDLARAMKFAIGVATDADLLVGVLIAAHPDSWDVDDGHTLQVTAHSDGHSGAAAMLYAAARRAAAVLGYRRLITYTNPGHSGATLRAAGFHPVAERRQNPTRRPAGQQQVPWEALCRR